MSKQYKNLSQAERRANILHRLKNDGNVRVSELSEQFSTSEVTIRSDLAELENEGLLQRVHGGAVQTVKNYYALDSSERLQERKVEKLQIAANVASLVNDGDNIIMNSGSTNYFIAQELIQKKNLRIITNSIQISEIFSANKDIEVILLGGNLNFQYLFTYGEDTSRQLEKYKVHKTILSVDGIDFDDGISTYHNEVSGLCRQMMQKASINIVAADHTKLGHTALAQIAELKMIDYLVTDTIPNSADLHKLNKLGMEVLTSKNKVLELPLNQFVK